MNLMDPRRRRAQRRSSAIGLLCADEDVESDNARRYNAKGGSYMERIRQGMESVQQSMEAQLDVARNMTNANSSGATANNNSHNEVGNSIAGTFNNLVSRASAAAASANIGTLSGVVGNEAPNKAWASMEDDDKSFTAHDKATMKWQNNALGASFGSVQDGFPDFSSEFKNVTKPLDNGDGFASNDTDGFNLEKPLLFDLENETDETGVVSVSESESIANTLSDVFPEGTLTVDNVPQFNPNALKEETHDKTSAEGNNASETAKSNKTPEEADPRSPTNTDRHNSRRSSRTRDSPSSKDRTRSKSRSKNKGRSRSHSGKRRLHSTSRKSSGVNDEDGDAEKVGNTTGSGSLVKSSSRHRPNRPPRASSTTDKSSSGRKSSSSRRIMQNPRDQLSKSEHFSSRPNYSKAKSMRLLSSSQHGGSSPSVKEAFSQKESVSSEKDQNALSQSEHALPAQQISRQRSMRSRSSLEGPNEMEKSSSRKTRTNSSDRRALMHSQRAQSFRLPSSRPSTGEQTVARPKEESSGTTKTINDATDKNSRQRSIRSRSFQLTRSSSMGATEMNSALSGDSKGPLRRKVKTGPSGGRGLDRSRSIRAGKMSSMHAAQESTRRLASMDTELAW